MCYKTELADPVFNYFGGGLCVIRSLTFISLCATKSFLNCNLTFTDLDLVTIPYVVT